MGSPWNEEWAAFSLVTRPWHTRMATQGSELRLCTLYPWLMPLMNCWGGGFQKNWMVVEFTASVCTFCGGAVGTVPRQSQKTAKQTVGGTVGRRDEKETLSCHSWFTGHYGIENREVWWMFLEANSGITKKKNWGYFSFSAGEFFKALAEKWTGSSHPMGEAFPGIPR